MKNRKIGNSIRTTSVLIAMLLAVLIAFPVHAAANKDISYEVVFDSTYYASHNPDLQVAFGNDSKLLLNHFIMYGMAEGRQGNAEFNVQYYKATYPDLQVVFGENLPDYYTHYIVYGKSEGRVGNGEVQNNIPAVGNSVENINNEDSVVSGYAYEVLELVNQVRIENGLSSVSTTPELMNTAKTRAIETATLFSHTRPDGSECFTAFEQNGVNYNTAGENIAAGQLTPKEVMNSWLNSPGHRANILNGVFKHMGIGYYQINDEYGIYWAQCFTN